MKKSQTSKKSAGRGSPVPPDIMRQAIAFADQYRFVFQLEPDGGYIGHPLEMPLVLGSGDTIDACYRDTMEAATMAVAAVLERGEQPPAPSREGKRDQQVNIRLTADEKMSLEAAANRDGFRSLSDFMRAASLQRSR